MMNNSNLVFKAIGFDADDTLWNNEIFFQETQSKFRKILQEYPLDEIDQKLLNIEKHNLQVYGYGIKGFILSLIETSIEISDQQINGRQIGNILDLGKKMFSEPIHLLENVEPTLRYLYQKYILLLITKGDLFEQETKIARSGLSKYFKYIEIVSEKDESTYSSILKRHDIDPKVFLMVGNSLRSDILPVLKIGGHALHIPYKITWNHEMEHPEINPKHYTQIKHLGLLKSWLERMS